MKKLFALTFTFLLISCHQNMFATRSLNISEPVAPAVNWPENGTTVSYRLVALSGVAAEAFEVTFKGV